MDRIETDRGGRMTETSKLDKCIEWGKRVKECIDKYEDNAEMSPETLANLDCLLNELGIECNYFPMGTEEL